MLKIITIVHMQDVFERGLKKSLAEQTGAEYDLSVIDNEGNKYTSLYSAYSSVLDKNDLPGDCDAVLFCHPDINLLNPGELCRMYEEVRSIFLSDESIGVVGVAGAPDGGCLEVVSTIVHGQSKTGMDSPALKENRFVEVQTVDACFFFVKAECLKKYPLDRDNHSFHMLIEEYCLRLRQNGIRSVVIPASLWHFSAGASLDYRYYKETKRVVKKYRSMKNINTTSFHWDNNAMLPVKLDYLALRNYIHHKIKG